MRHGGKVLVDQLRALGVSRVYMVPGESFLAALDALYDTPGISGVICRHEGGASMMATAEAKLTAKPGVAFVTRGPGAVNAASGVYIARQDETPLVLLVGLPPQRAEGLRPFQDIDLTALYGSIAKHVSIVRRSEYLPALLVRAFHTAQTGRPGPVVIGLPQDVLDGSTAVESAKAFQAVEPAPSPAAMTALEGLIKTAQSPMLIVGGPGWSPRVKQQIEEFAQRFDMPVACSFRCQDYIDNQHSSFAGHIGFGLDKKLAAGVRIADLLIVVGAPLDEVTTAANTLIESPAPRQAIVHVHPDPDTIGALHQTALGIVSCAQAFSDALRFIEPPRDKPWSALRRDLKAAYEASTRIDPKQIALEEDGTSADVSAIIKHVAGHAPDDAILCNGAGNYAQFLHRYFTYKTYRSCLAPVSGSMGFGVPAAIAAKLTRPDQTVIAFAGDGCFMMSEAELATAVQYQAKIIIIVINNGMYGTIRMHQEATFPGRVSGTTLVNPDFANLARAYGALGERVETTSDFAAAFERALNANGPAVIDVLADPDTIAPGKKLSSV